MDMVWRMASPCDVGVINKIIIPKVWTFSNTKINWKHFGTQEFKLRRDNPDFLSACDRHKLRINHFPTEPYASPSLMTF